MVDFSEIETREKNQQREMRKHLSHLNADLIFLLEIHRALVLSKIYRPPKLSSKAVLENTWKSECYHNVNLLIYWIGLLEGKGKYFQREYLLIRLKTCRLLTFPLSDLLVVEIYSKRCKLESKSIQSSEKLFLWKLLMC